ncbi:DUF697 domain-containing protein [Chamaesiphon sp.]|uniref:DUF697 domain-containing protein n=1 Tax=Chamaesiphon sp. TaxID=2814140 RepID=UPI003593169A
MTIDRAPSLDLSNHSLAIYLIHYNLGIQGITVAYLTRIAGRSFIKYFHQDRSSGDGGMAEAVQQQFQLNRKDEFLKASIHQAIASGTVKLNETIEHYRQ